MNNYFHINKLVAALLVAVLAAVAVPLPALADDEPPPAPAETSTPEDTEALPAEGMQETAPTATEAPVDEFAIDEPVIEETTAIETTDENVQEFISELPENTNLIVVDEAGEPLPLASGEAADAMAAGDPIWCPASVTMPVDGGSGCSPSQTSFAALITWLENNPQSVAGTIWIEKTFDSGDLGADPGVALFTLDGASTGNLPTMGNFALTIKGGWNGLGFNTINTIEPSEFNGALQILNWNADITLSDLLFTGIPSGDALYIDTSKKITLTRVDVVDNGGNGAVLDNTDSGAGTGALVITTSTFSGNTGDGLTVNSRGTITGSYISANGNTGYGAVFSNDTAPSDLAVTLTGINEFKFNDGGLQINSRGAVTLKNIYANYNTTDEGATIDNTASITGASVTLTGINQFIDNGSHGLEILSKGSITINKLSANGNGFAEFALTGFGAHLDNSGASLPKLVLLTTSNSFSDNEDYGLLVESKGSVTIALLSADRNGGNGAEINNLATLTSSPQNVTFSGAGSFTENNGVGLTINTYGAVLLGGVTANDNNLDGTAIDNSTGLASLPKSVTLNGSNNFINNGGFGVQIDSHGTITLNAVFADENFSFGAWLNNSTATTAAAVMVKGTNEFNDNGGYGLNIQSKGNITLYNFDSIGNGSYGVELINNISNSVGNVSIITTLTNWCNALDENNGRGLLVNSFGVVSVSYMCSYYNAGEGIRIDNSAATTAKAVKMTGNNTNSDNDETGLVILSKGAITINNLYASGNGWNETADLLLPQLDGLGAYINNLFGGTSALQNVSQTGYSSFYDNFFSGLEIYSYGAITLSNVISDNNGNGEELEENRRGYGALLDNLTGYGIYETVSPRPITLLGTNSFTTNWDGGIQILASGSMTLNKITASQNIGFGGSFSQTFPSQNWGGKGNLIINGYGEFKGNGGDGIDVYEIYGSVTIANLTARDNLGSGATFRVEGSPGVAGTFTLSGANTFNVNGGHGLNVTAYGNINISNIYTFSNYEFGTKLEAAFDTGSITLTGIARFGWNGGDGFSATAGKPIILPILYSANNAGNGAYLSISSSVKIAGQSEFVNNWDNGLRIIASGSVALSSITAVGNGDLGVWVNNTNGPVSGTLSGVTLTGTNIFNGNGWDGLAIESYGAIKVNNVTANGNGGSGAYLDNLWDYDIHSGITLTGTNTFNNNTGPYSGLDMYSHGTITANNVTANGNSGGGATAWNWSYTGNPVNVTFTGINSFNNNLGGIDQGFGLYVKTEGAVTLNNVTANGNEQGGVYLNNYDWSWTNPAVTINGINEFSDNGLNGIYIKSDGNVSLTRVTAELNMQTGVSIDTTGKVTLTCASLNFNDDRGWQILGSGGITLYGVLTYGNTDGAYLLLGGSLTQVRSCPLS